MVRFKPESRRAKHLQRKFGLTVGDYDCWVAAQESRCAICGIDAAERQRGLAVDHDHATDDIRGLLCFNCNTGLGKFRDDPDLLRAAARYIESGGGLQYAGLEPVSYT